MSKPNSGIVSCLVAAERAHRQLHPGGRRQDPNWPQWYADFLLGPAGLLSHTSRQWQADELAEALAQLDAAYFNGSQNQSWAVYTAARLSL